MPADRSDLFVISPAPHLHSGESVRRVMWSVVLALVPALAASVYYFGPRAALLEATAVFSAVLTESLIQKLRRVPVTVLDGSAVITGLLLAFNLPPGVPLWLAAVGAAFGIAIGKHAFGGLGQNVFNPALVGRVFVMHSWITRMTSWSPPLTPLYADLNGATYATPLNALKESLPQFRPALESMFWGNIGGCIGETSALALLLGGLFLLLRGYIRWQTPVAFVGTVALLTAILPPREGVLAASPLYHVLSGGLLLGAIFMATDMVTAPITGKGRLVFGLGCGAITALIRLYGGYPEGVSYSILIMNAVTPLIDRFTAPRPFGWQPKATEASRH